MFILISLKVFLGHIQDRLITPLPKNVHERLGIKRMTKSTVIFEDDTEEEVDTLIYCTGFLYNMPFLDGVVTVENEHVMPVFNNVVHIEKPTLMFIGLQKVCAYFIHNYESARFAVRYLLDLVQLPPKSEMYEDVRKEQEYRKGLGLRPNYAHFMGSNDLQWKWNEELSAVGGFNPLPKLKRNLWDAGIDKLQKDFMHFREYNYKITNTDSFEVSHVS